MLRPVVITLDQEPEVGLRVKVGGGSLEALTEFRPRLGEAFTVRSPGGDYRARLLGLGPDEAELFVFERMTGPAESPLEIILLQALPDKERMELVIEKTTELGVSLIVPWKAERGIGLSEREEKQAKSKRWPKRARKAARQCRRARIPAIASFTSLEGALEFAEAAEAKIALYEGSEKPLKDVLDNASGVSVIALLVGPEGGLTENEMGKITKAGFSAVTLGGRVLRAETAGIAAVSIVQYALGDLGGQIFFS